MLYNDIDGNVAINNCRKSPFAFLSRPFMVALIEVFMFWKLTILAEFASLHPLKLFVFLNGRFNYTNTANNCWHDFITNWSSRTLKKQTNLFLELDRNLTVKSHPPWSSTLRTPPLVLIAIIVCETSSFLIGKSQLCWQGKWKRLVAYNKGWESELLHFSFGANTAFTLPWPVPLPFYSPFTFLSLWAPEG